jgi:hypothetical protein
MMPLLNPDLVHLYQQERRAEAERERLLGDLPRPPARLGPRTYLARALLALAVRLDERSLARTMLVTE